MRKLLLSLGLSLSFIGLVFLAFNPHIVVEIERKFNPDAAPEIEPAIEADVVDDPEILDVPEGRAEIETSPENLPKNDLPEISNPVLTPPVKPVFPQTLRPNREDLPRLKGYEDIPVSDPWIGETPCSIEIFNPPLSLSTLSPRRDGGPILDPDIFKADNILLDQPSYLYNSSDGVTLRLIQPVIKYYHANGRNFREAYKDIFDNQPLKSSAKKSQKDTQKQRTVTLANISYPLSVSYILTGHGDNYQLYPKDVEITAAYILTLPKWKTYRLASKADQDKWDDLFCKAIHHELGHLRINLDIISETLNGYAHLPRGVSTAKLTEAAKAYGEDVNAAVQKRQDIYHLYNGEGVRRGMVELPYAELPFPWLEAPTKD